MSNLFSSIENLKRHRDDLMVELSQTKDERDYWRRLYEALEAKCGQEDEGQDFQCVKCRKRPMDAPGSLFCGVCSEAM